MKKFLSALFIFAAFAVTAQEKIYAPSLTSPANAATNQNVNVLLDWGPVSGAIAYQVNLDTSATFTNPQVVVVQYSAWQSSELLFNTVYNWRVRAIDAAGDTSAWSLVRSYTTTVKPVTSYPALNSKYACLQPKLKWNAVSGVTKYECKFDSVTTFDSPLFATAIINGGVDYQVYGLDYGDDYYWQVRAIHTNDTSEWSDLSHFITRDSTALMADPEDGDTGIMPNDSLKFKSICGTNRYEIVFDDDPAFTSPYVFYWDSTAFNIRVVSATASDTTARGILDTIPFGTFYWKVRLMTDNDTSKWTEVRTLSTVSKVNMTSPTNNSVDVPVTTAFTWEAIGGAKFYILEYDTDAAFSSPVKVNVTGTSYTPASHLLSQTNYYWRVRCATVTDTTAVWDEYTFKTYFGVGIEDNAIASWSVYPNPTTGVFYLTVEDATSSRIEILNVLGDVVYSQDGLVNGSNAISIENLNNGMYMMRLYLNDKTYVSRIIKK